MTSRRLVLLRGALAGCFGALVLVAVLVVVPTSSAVTDQLDRTLRDSGVVVVAPASTGTSTFEDPAGAMRLAGTALLFGLAAGGVLALVVARYHRAWLWGGAGLLLSAAALGVARHATWRELGAQLGFWTVCTLMVGRGFSAAQPSR